MWKSSVSLHKSLGQRSFVLAGAGGDHERVDDWPTAGLGESERCGDWIGPAGPRVTDEVDDDDIEQWSGDWIELE